MFTRWLLLLCLSFISFWALSQPVLPDISGSTDKGIVILSWTNQYSGIKSISVLHSQDSIRNFTNIGEVQKMDKGVQAFVDGHAIAGNNFYKLSILYTSGLKWASNLCKVTVPSGDIDNMRPKLPTNDSLQKYLVNGRINQYELPISHKNTSPSNEQTTPTKPKVAISFAMDTLQVTSKQYLDTSTNHNNTSRKISITFDDPDTNPSGLTKPRFLSTDTSTGHVVISMPNDIKQHNYSIKFYNEHNHVINEIPHINYPKIILDKRNFQRKGMYKFIIRRDVVELETGFITIFL